MPWKAVANPRDVRWNLAALKRIARCHPGALRARPGAPAATGPFSARSFAHQISTASLEVSTRSFPSLISMDRKSILILVVCFVALMLWYPLINKLYPPKPLPPAHHAPPATVTATNQAPITSVPPVIAESPITAPKPIANTNLRKICDLNQ